VLYLRKCSNSLFQVTEFARSFKLCVFKLDILKLVSDLVLLTEFGYPQFRDGDKGA
jgi:hypothetical protein